MQLAMKCQISNQKAELPWHKPESHWQNWWQPATSQLHLFFTTRSLLRTILDPASWWLSQRCDSGTAAFAAEIWSHMGQMASTACKDPCIGQITNTDCKKSCGTSLLRLQQWHPCKWQDQDVSLDRQIYHRMVAGVEINKYVTVVT